MRQFSNTKINIAGKMLLEDMNDSQMTLEEAENILTYWRYIHTPILNTFQATLRIKLAKKYKKRGIVAQRLKRSTSIVDKLRREPTMKLSTMQDIAGIRVILQNLKDTKSIYEQLVKTKAKHLLKSTNDYITNPKSSGYRSIHLIFQYTNQKLPESNGLKIELQIRTKLQHIWATTVETMGTFLNKSLKSSEGPKPILEFFKIASSAFALIEKAPILSEHYFLEPNEIFNAVITQYDSLNIEDKLAGFSVAVDHITQELKSGDYKYYIVTLEIDKKEVTINYYKANQLEKANQEYTDIERKIKDGLNWQSVLVSTDKLSALQKAYPNYFLDTRDFVTTIGLIRKTLYKE